MADLCHEPHPDRPDLLCDKTLPCMGYHANGEEIWGIQDLPEVQTRASKQAALDDAATRTAPAVTTGEPVVGGQTAAPDDDSIQARFEAFHQTNPHVYAALEEMSQQLHDRGRERIGIELLFAQLRWQSLIATSGDEFKLNDHFTSRYARLLIQNHPEWTGLFEMRALRTK